ncbi:MAG: hypothetical protein KGH59_03870 [Candidatus Micrarchaeota archaeon]|nr:hypothetical protein [Candidatus Micrarchaeota archaeon]
MEEDSRLVMRIPISASLRPTIANLKKELSEHPALSLVSEGTELSYLSKRGADGEFYLFRFGREYIVAERYSRLSPIYSLRESLLSLMGIISFLGDSYEVRLGSIFPYLIHALASQDLAVPGPKMDSRLPEKKSDIILAKRIIGLHSELAEAKSEVSKRDSTACSLLAHLAVHDSSSGRIEMSEFARRYGASERLLKGMEANLSSMGYRLIRHEADKASVVRS